MGEFWGADTEGLQDLYRTFERGSDDMEDEFKRLGNSMWGFNRPQWEGPDADAFFAEWEQVSNKAYELYHRIEEMGRQLREEAQEQDDASEPEDGFLDTLKDIGEQLVTGWGIFEDITTEIWKGLKTGKFDWPAFEEGGNRLKDWWNNAEFDKKLGKLVNAEGFKRIAKFIPIVDIPLTIDGIINADDPVERLAEPSATSPPLSPSASASWEMHSPSPTGPARSSSTTTSRERSATGSAMSATTASTRSAGIRC